MSMIANYLMTDEQSIAEIQNGALAIEDLLYGEDDEGPEGETLDIDKAWHAIHFLLTGEAKPCAQAGPLSLAVLGGTPINDEDVGYGPAQFLTAQEVRTVAQALGELCPETLRARFNLDAMRQNGIYPVTANENADAFFEYVAAYFDDLCNFFQTAARQEKCILFYLN